MAGVCLIVLDHANDAYLRESIASARAFCPEAEVAWYDSGTSGEAPPPGVNRLAVSRPLRYAKVAPFFLDMLEWAAESDHEYVVNLETDLAFVARGFERFVEARMREADHLAPRFQRETRRTSRWRPYHSLKPELPELTGLLGTPTTDRCFSPAQVFSRRYARAAVTSPIFGRLRAFVEENQLPGRSFSLQEVLMPTLTRALGLRVAGYPPEGDRFNRYRPYHSAASVTRAAREASVYFVHPLRRDMADAGRQAARALVRQQAAAA